MNNNFSKASKVYLAVRYSLEFLVVVLGITVSFWLSEWSMSRQELNHQSQDAKDLLQDLQSDKVRLERVYNDIKLGITLTGRIQENCKLLQRGDINYTSFSDSLINIGSPYSWRTFFMNDGAYKTLLNNGRIQNFPSEIEDAIKEYYEYVSKRVRDNNTIIDNVSLNYYLTNHPMCMLYGNNDEKRDFMKISGVQEKYESIDFYTSTLGLRNRILAHNGQVKEYMVIREQVDSLLADFLRNQTLSKY